LVIKNLFFLQKKKEELMIIQLCSLNSYYPYDWDDRAKQERWPVTYRPSELLEASKNPSHPQLIFSPLLGVMEIWRPTKRRAAVDRFCDRLKTSQYTGADLAIEYLKEKYSHNMAISTIKQAGGVILSFFAFLAESGTDIHRLTRQDVSGYVAQDQDNGLKSGAIRTKLRAIYAFIHFLVDREVLPYELLYKKIRIKPEELLPKAIPSQDLQSLLSVIGNIRDRALILLLLRTGMRIGELLGVKMPDIHLSDQKILLYQGEKNYQGRVVYFNEDAKEALKRWLAIRDTSQAFLFYSKSRKTISYVAAWNIMRNALDAAGLSHKGYSLHCLRHTFATDMLNAGLRLEVLQQLLGHQSIEITRRYARMSDKTREIEYFKAMTTIENGGSYEPHRINTELQKVFTEKKFISSYGKELPA
jgi:integrase/recombinase XerD